MGGLIPFMISGIFANNFKKVFRKGHFQSPHNNLILYDIKILDTGFCLLYRY